MYKEMIATSDEQLENMINEAGNVRICHLLDSEVCLMNKILMFVCW